MMVVTNRCDWPKMDSSFIQLLGLFDTTNPDTLQSQAMFKSALALSHLYNITYHGYPLGWQEFDIIDSSYNNESINELDITCQAVSKSKIIGIIGSINSLIALFAEKIGIPSMASFTSDILSRNQYSTLHRVLPTDITKALAIAQLFTKYEWTQCVVINTIDLYGLNGLDVLTEQFNKNSVRIVNKIRFDTITQTILDGDLEQLLITGTARIIVVWANSNATMSILDNAIKQNVLSSKFLWILTSNITLDKYNSTERKKFVGTLIVDTTVGSVINEPVNTTLLNNVCDIWQQYEPETFPGQNGISPSALFTFDAAWTLIQSLKGLNTTEQLYYSNCSTNCFDCQLYNVNYLLNIVQNISFLGLTGLVSYDSQTNDRLSNGSYFLIQNIQPTTNLNDIHFMSVLKWINSKWYDYIDRNLIVWPGIQLNPFVDYPTLDSIPLRICVVNVEPFIIMENNSNHSMIGYSMDIINVLQQQLGFIPNIILQPSNRTRDQLIDDLVNNVYDM
ncbi:unnamed protein product, partial [Didymodactylos carnosus]